jgi:DNA-binding CsgD family transcriptional regulator
MLYKFYGADGVTLGFMVSDIVRLAKVALGDVDRAKVMGLLDAVNLTLQEKEIVRRTELDGERLSDMADVFSLSIDSVSLIKRQALRKIGIYLTQKLR